MNVIDPTRARLIRWGRWAQGGLRGYPLMVAWMRIAFGQETGAAPDEEEVDRIVCRAEQPQRQILVVHFCFRGPVRQKANQLGIPKSTYWDRIDEAIWFVHTELDRPDRTAKFRVNMRQLPA